ncbi:MAG: methyl-accepting chemotaxis protein [Holophaga sp.]
MRWTLRTKVMGLTIVCATFIVTVVTALNISTTVKRGRERVAIYRETLLNERKNQLRACVEMAVRVLEGLPQDQALKVAATMRYGKDGYIWINDTANFMLVHPSPALQGTDTSGLRDPNGIYIVRDITRLCVESGEGFLAYSWKKPGHDELIPKISFAKAIPSRHWCVGTGMYVDDVDASVGQEQALVHTQVKDAIFRSMAITLVLTVLMVGAAMVIIRRSISGPVEAITRSMKNFNNDLTLVVPATTSDEVGELARWINDHIQKLHEVISLVSEVTGKIYINGGTIASSMEKQASFATELSSSVVEIATTMEEFSSTATQIAQHSQGVVRRADQTLVETRSGAAEVENLAVQISNLNQGIQNSLGEIVELGRKSHEINKVMEIINNIASQTKLIAFNAALEAASAGESGKRFGVVALEIRRLADSVVESTGEIEGRIAEILDAVNRLVMSSEKSSHIAEQGQEHATRTVSVLTGILNGVEETTDAARQISLSTQQQQVASSQVVIALRDIEQGVKFSTDTARSTKDATSELAEFSHKLRYLVDSFKLDGPGSTHDQAGR